MPSLWQMRFKCDGWVERNEASISLQSECTSWDFYSKKSKSSLKWFPGWILEMEVPFPGRYTVLYHMVRKQSDELSLKVRRAHSQHVLQLLNNVLLMDCHITWDVLCFVSWVTLLDFFKKISYTYSIHFD